MLKRSLILSSVGLSLISWGQASAMPAMKVHLIENLSTQESSLVQKFMKKKGYFPSELPLFEESKNAVVITKVIGNESEPASIQVEVIQKEESHSIPKRIFNIKLDTQDLNEALEKLPAPEKLKTIPVALQS